MSRAKTDPSPLRDERRQAVGEKDYRAALAAAFEQGPGSTYERLEHFPKYVSRQTLARYLALGEIFRLALDVHGSIVQCGVNHGGSLLLFAQLSAILEPVNLQRRIFGFDTFSGFPGIARQDRKRGAASPQARAGGYAGGSRAELEQCVSLFDRNRFVGHVPKVALVEGDATKTIPRFVQDNPELVVSLLHLDFDLYEPTLAALRHFVPRIPKGGVIVFDELNNAAWPGETRAVHEALGLSALRIRRLPYEPHISYCVVE